jgi:hypothetical protein
VLLGTLEPVHTTQRDPLLTYDRNMLLQARPNAHNPTHTTKHDLLLIHDDAQPDVHDYVFLFSSCEGQT